MINIVFFIYYITYSKYVFEYECVIANINIDKTKPIGEVIYSTTELSKEPVLVTVVFNEQIQEVLGWQLLEDKKTILKTFYKNDTETIVVKDLYQNETIINVVVKNIYEDALIKTNYKT